MPFRKFRKASKCYGEVNKTKYTRKSLANVGPNVDLSPLDLALANAFLLHFQKNYLQNSPTDFKPHSYWWYVDDIFVLYTSPEH